jgi:hypothetical protein
VSDFCCSHETLSRFSPRKDKIKSDANTKYLTLRTVIQYTPLPLSPSEPRASAMASSSDESEEDAAASLLEMRDAALVEVLRTGFSADTKLQPAAVTLTSVLVRAFLEEACARAAKEARDEGGDEVTDEHLEKILPQLLLDMGP